MVNGFFRTLFFTALFSMTASAFAQQFPVLSKTRPAGTKDAEDIFQTGMRIRSGKGGEKKNPEMAGDYFELSMTKGSAKAALALADMYRYEFVKKGAKSKRDKYRVTLYDYAAKAGCPDAWAALAGCHEKGAGMKKNLEKAQELAQKAAEAGSPKGMEIHGRLLIEQKKDVETGRQWLQRAINAGNGDAGMPLADTYAREKDVLGIVRSLREGAAKGSRPCLMVLSGIFANGHYGQTKDASHAACYRKLAEAMDPYDTPQPIANLDRLCPKKKFLMPFKNR
ncbi:sel1 repeat family protein [Oxalobacter sp. OttesenSCG-928-P03]|nr:sel1 repeat family protein [Oxalobacter sp. OttesenSCG-928-P03]